MVMEVWKWRLNGDVWVMVKQELGEKTCKVRRVNDGMIALVSIFEDVLGLTCGYVSQGRSLDEKEFMMS